MHTTGRILTLLVYGLGVMVGVIIMSLITNYKCLSHHTAHRSLMTSSDIQELVSLEKEHGGRLSRQEQEPIYFKDEHLHNDDESVAKRLHDEVRILCWVLTKERNHVHKAMVVKATWGKRCTKLIFISNADDPSLPAINIDVPSGHDHLTAKTMKGFDIFYKEVDNFDWFMKADDDTFVILENLRYFLSSQNPDSPIYFGHHFKTALDRSFFRGGAGYVISREVMRRFGKREPNMCAKDFGDEDVEFGGCMEKLGVRMGDSRDSVGRTRFYSDIPASYYPSGDERAIKGKRNVSDYAISLHYATEKDLYKVEFLLYHIRPYGISSGYQNLNTAL